MLRNAKFNLATRNKDREYFVAVKRVCDDCSRRRITEKSCNFKVECQIQSDCADGVYDETNYKICKILELRLAEQLPRNARNAWSLSLEFSTGPSGTKVAASGKILEQLQALMSNGANNFELKLMLSADLNLEIPGTRHCHCGCHDSEDEEEEEERSTAKYHTELHALMENDNCLDHSTYLDTEGTKAVFNIKTVDNIKIWIEGMKKKIAKTNSPDFMQLLRDKGFGPELTLQYKVVNAEEDNSPLRVHENILIAQSPVIKTMLEKDNFSEGATGTISMTNWTKDEVTAFIHYLYFGDLELALNNSKLAVTMYEMANYYDVTSLEGAIKTVLLNMTFEAEPWKPDDCIRLFNTADSAKDCGLKQMAVDMLKQSAGLQSNNGTSLEETFSSNEVMPQEMLLMSMKI